MKLHGTIGSNLQDAIASAKRLRGHPVYSDTLSYWNDLLHEARRFRSELDEPNRDALDILIAQMEDALADRRPDSRLR
jgi:hypothetical protein